MNPTKPSSRYVALDAAIAAEAGAGTLRLDIISPALHRLAGPHARPRKGTSWPEPTWAVVARRAAAMRRTGRMHTPTTEGPQ